MANVPQAQNKIGLPGFVEAREGPYGCGIYVDACVWPYGRMIMCHLIADRVEDLHAMADRIGVSRRWFQNTRYPHYDICKSKRTLAVKLGAQEIDRRQFVEIARRLETEHLAQRQRAPEQQTADTE